TTVSAQKTQPAEPKAAAPGIVAMASPSILLTWRHLPFHRELVEPRIEGESSKVGEIVKVPVVTKTPELDGSVRRRQVEIFEAHTHVRLDCGSPAAADHFRLKSTRYLAAAGACNRC